MGFFNRRECSEQPETEKAETEKSKNQILETPKEEDGMQKLENKKADYDKTKEDTETKKKPEQKNDDAEDKEKDDEKGKLENRKADWESKENKEDKADHGQEDKREAFVNRLKEKPNEQGENHKLREKADDQGQDEKLKDKKDSGQDSDGEGENRGNNGREMGDPLER